MKTVLAVFLLVSLAACQTTPNLESETRYIRLARVVGVHVYTDEERRQAARAERRESHTNVNLGLGFGFGLGGGSYGGISIGMPLTVQDSGNGKLPPLVSRGANRYSVQPLHTLRTVEVNSYDKFELGQCVKLFSGSPTDYDRLFPLKPGESCGPVVAPAKEK